MALPSAYAVANLLALNNQRYSQESGRKLARVRLSRNTLSAISRRKTFRDAFVSELQDSLEDLGWILIQVPDGGVAMIDADSVSGWTKISASRVAREMRDVKRGKITEEDLEDLVEGQVAEDDEEPDSEGE